MLVIEDHITWVLNRADGAHRFIEEIMWRSQMEERYNGLESGVTSAKLRIIKEALQQLKSDYLQLFMEMELALRFSKDKER